ncbi:hypothetical protein [Novosphingobium sp.]|uniref:hypothetical protein n=1 Tax=Novosphingobium sp. TaxID=1874826 RepID=UPI0025DAE9CF|nr:hypothetical protein [Novosphingobium sp.]
MEFGDFMGLAAVVIGFISITGILTGAYKSKLRVRERELELQIMQANRNAEKAPPATARIEQRLRVLERIATDAAADKGPNLAEQIEQLRDARQTEVL